MKHNYHFSRLNIVRQAEVYLVINKFTVCIFLIILACIALIFGTVPWIGNWTVHKI
jgi:hypothetical protein